MSMLCTEAEKMLCLYFYVDTISFTSDTLKTHEHNKFCIINVLFVCYTASCFPILETAFHMHPLQI